ncbi:MAG: DUF3696 domain-containing protein [Rhizomicrobium sp.]
MFKSWRLKNFKSFGDQPDLKLSSINVLAGANSSGKSSIIQSILLLKQTIQYGSEDRSVALNGPLLRLGNFEDVLNHGSEDGSIEIGFEIGLTESSFKAQSPWVRALSRGRLLRDAVSLRSISLEMIWKKKQAEWSLGDVNAQKQRKTPSLMSTCLRSTRVVGEKSENSLTKFTREFAPETDESVASVSEFKVDLDDLSEQEVSAGKPEAKVVGGFLSFFLPWWISLTYNRSAKEAIELADAVCDVRNSFFADTHITESDIPDGVLSIINGWLSERGRPTLELSSGVSVRTARDAVRKSLPQQNILFFEPSPQANETDAALARLKGQIKEQMLLNYQPPQYDSDIEIPKINSELVNFIKEYFKQGVRYLGPLRDSPRPVYQVEALESTTNVGYRGEHTAAVLDLNGRRRVSYVKPPNSDTILPVQRAGRALTDAVVEWLVYLGVATNVLTEDADVFGHRLQVTTHLGGQFHDLTNVGVGVSQVLPIVVMALLAPPGSLLIFEQPELHLHPKVQARLGDFFIALALDQKQVLLETHSEYLIDRLRLRIAQTESDEIRSLINILFSEQVDGQSKLTSLEVSEYGAISNWPKDFFDQSHNDVSAIIRAASEKRRSRKTD